MENFKAVIFDMDGTMFDTETLQLKTWIAIGKKYNFNITEALVKSSFGISRPETKQLFLKALGDDFDFDYYRDMKERNMKAYVEKNGVPQKRGLMQLLNYLRDNRYALAIATSSTREKTYKYLDKAGITDYFHVIITGDMVSKGKPEPEIFLTAFENLNNKFGNIPKSQCIVVEDTPSGVKAANRAGINVIMVPDMIQPTPDVEEVLYAKYESLVDVKRMLEKEKGVNIKREQKAIRRIKIKKNIRRVEYVKRRL
ncbi:MAG: HAD family phosphatase [Clostridiales bacterium]|nr:HAD family phosphatase [Clostridiales bacterium]